MVALGILFISLTIIKYQAYMKVHLKAYTFLFPFGKYLTSRICLFIKRCTSIRETYTVSLSREVMMRVLFNTLLICIMSSCQIQSHPNNNYPIKHPDELAKNLLESFHNSISDTIIYPQYYGGMYVDHHNNKCVIWVIGDTISAKNDLLKRCNGSGFIISNSSVSLSYLAGLIKKIEMYISTPLGKEVKLHGIYLDEIHNKINVILGDTTTQNITYFKNKIMDSPFFTFEQGEGLKVDMEFKPIK